MRIIKYISAFVLTAMMLTSCYEDYVEDFDYTSTVFGSQKPLRTVVADDDMTFQVGASLGGMRVDDGSHSVSFMVDTSLMSELAEASAYTLLPSAYYELSNDAEFDIVKDHMRVVNVTLTDAFAADSDAVNETYALPLRITSASVDSIHGLYSADSTVGILDDLGNKDITLLVVKYISPYSGYYYSKGVQYELAGDGSYVDTLNYSDESLSQNDAIYLTTIVRNVVETSRIGGNLPGGLEFTMNADGSVTVASADVTIDSGTVTYDASATTYTIDLVVDKAGVKYEIKEELILRQAPELDLRFEEW